MQTTDYDLNKQVIEEVRHAADIVRIVGRQVNLRKQGSNYIGLCPFHKEKTPSFSVSPNKHMYYCFGCGASGDVFTFLQEMEGMNFPEAVVELAREAGIHLPKKSKQSKEQHAQRDNLLDACQAAAELFERNLQENSAAAVREYLEKRGFDAETCKNYGIGYAPEGYENLLNSLGRNFSTQVLLKAGLIQESQRGEGHYDRFRNRIIIPIHNTSGEIIAFGGRIFGDGEPKYLNSPETALFNKSKVLFGLYQGYKSLRKQGFVILVEGYFDAIALHRGGFINTVAPLGTSFGEGHARILSRYCSKAVLALDSDTAGNNAALKAATTLLREGFAVNILSLPDGQDPDSYIQENGKEGFSDRLRRSSTVIRFALRLAREGYEVERATGKRQALDFLLPLLSAYGDQLQRSEAVTTVAQELDIPEHTIIAALRSQRASGPEDQTSQPEPLMVPKYEQELLRSALANPEKAQKAVEEYQVIEYLSEFMRNLLTQIWQQSKAGKTLNHSELVDTARDDAEKHFITQIIMTEDDAVISPEECARGIAIDNCLKQLNDLNREIGQLDNDTRSEERLNELYARKLTIKQQIISLEDSEGR